MLRGAGLNRAGAGHALCRSAVSCVVVSMGAFRRPGRRDRGLGVGRTDSTRRPWQDSVRARRRGDRGLCLAIGTARCRSLAGAAFLCAECPVLAAAGTVLASWPMGGGRCLRHSRRRRAARSDGARAGAAARIRALGVAGNDGGRLGRRYRGFLRRSALRACQARPVDQPGQEQGRGLWRDPRRMGVWRTGAHRWLQAKSRGGDGLPSAQFSRC